MRVVRPTSALNDNYLPTTSISLTPETVSPWTISESAKRLPLHGVRVLRALLSPFWYNRACPVFLRRRPLSDVTRILSQIESGDPSAAEQLLPLVYDELRKLAAAKLAHEKPGQTLQATALGHEAYLGLVQVEQAGGG
jgi:hypothetical protein